MLQGSQFPFLSATCISSKRRNQHSFCDLMKGYRGGGPFSWSSSKRSAALVLGLREADAPRATDEILITDAHVEIPIAHDHGPFGSAF